MSSDEWEFPDWRESLWLNGVLMALIGCGAAAFLGVERGPAAGWFYAVGLFAAAVGAWLKPPARGDGDE